MRTFCAFLLCVGALGCESIADSSTDSTELSLASEWRRPPPFEGDPCDFSQGLTFSYEQVLACYRSVPFCSDPSDPIRCDRDTQVAHARAAIEGFSDLRATYQERYRWEQRLERISRTRFKNDYEQFLAFADFFASFRSDHFRYVGPECFESTIFSVLPINFGSASKRLGARRHPEQFIYLRQAQPAGYGFDLSGWNDLYLSTTGIDVSTLAGQRVVRINGEEPIRFFRRWGREALQHDEDEGINLMSVLDEAGYTLRTGSFNPFPESRSVVLVLETPSGQRSEIELPWMFVSNSVFGSPAPTSTSEFHALCFPSAEDSAIEKSGPSQRTPGPLRREPLAYAQRIAERRALMDAAREYLGGGRRSPPVRGPFTEVPPEELNQGITEVFPLTEGARTVATADGSVAIQIRHDFVGDWDDAFDAGAQYACDNADRLIIDLRGNLGGFVSRVMRFAHYLNGKPAYPDSVLAFRELNASPAFNELRALSETLEPLGFPACFTGFEDACIRDPRNGEVLNNPEWFFETFRERRGKRIESLTRLQSQLNGPLADFVIPCPRKFTGKKLIVFLNGLNTSAGFFAPELLRGVGTLVSSGGLEGERMTTGRARGGPVVETSFFTDTSDFLEEVVGDVQHALPKLQRGVSMAMEMDAFYRPKTDQLFVDERPYGDLQIPFWSNSEETDGAAYRAAISAVERRAVVDPACGSVEAARRCDAYEACATRALFDAVTRGDLSSLTADRTLEDAVTACQAR